MKLPEIQYFFLILLVITGCERSDPRVPYFRAKINGEPFKAKSFMKSPPSSQHSLDIKAANYNLADSIVPENAKHFWIILDHDCLKPGWYELGECNYDSSCYHFFYSFKENGENKGLIAGIYPSVYDGYIEILTIENNNGWEIRGNFEVSGRISDENNYTDTVLITEGEFYYPN